MKNIWIILLSLCVGGLLSTMLMRSCQQPQIPPQPQIIRDTVIDVQIDTQYFPKPVPYKVEVRDTVYIVNSFQNSTDWKVLVQEIKEYKDSTYYARISGINAYLEEIRVYPKAITQYVNTKEYIYVPPKKWSIGIQGGVGITPKGLQPYIGFGVERKISF